MFAVVATVGPMATTATEALWSGRVQAWRESGVSAAEFARGKGFAASTLRLWSSRVRPLPRLVELVRRPSAAAVVVSAPELVVEVGAVRVRVGRGFDAELLREVVAAVSGAR